MQPSHFLDRLLHIERRIRRIYQALSTRGAFPEALRAVWHTLAEQTNNHRACLERTAGFVQYTSETPTMSEQNVAALESSLAMAEAAIASPELQIEAAFRLALRLEGADRQALEQAWWQGIQLPGAVGLPEEPPTCERRLDCLQKAVQTFSTDPALHQQAVTLWSTARPE